MTQIKENTFNSDWIIDLVKEQAPERLDVIEALANCQEGRWESRAYIYFANSKNANQLGADWQFEENIVFEHKTKGTIIIDFLKNGKIGGIEFVKYIK